MLAAVVAVALTAAAPSTAGKPALLELRTATDTYQGKLFARGSNACWLLGRDGALQFVELNGVKEFRTVSPQFRSDTPGDISSRLQKEFGKEFEVAGTRHYLVCAPRGKSRQFADLFEEVYRTFHMYFAVRGFTIAEPEFPLVAVVFPDQPKFADYCRKDGTSASAGLLGYYLPKSNRVALYTTAHGELEKTIVHEATHQVAFNVGLHNRIGANPKWVVEGLATVFEADGIRDSSKNRSTTSRINRERFLWFKEFMQRRPPKSLADFIGGDALYESATLDAYSQGWALTFFLVETRPREYAGFLKSIASRDPLSPYSHDERVADFKKAFGEHMDLFEADFLRFFERMK